MYDVINQPEKYIKKSVVFLNIPRKNLIRKIKYFD